MTYVLFIWFLYILPVTSAVWNYSVIVKTANNYFSGTDDPVYLDIHGSKSSLSKAPLKTGGRDSIKRNSLRSYTVVSETDLGVICRVALLKDGGDDWNVEYVTITENKAAVRIQIEFNEWIKREKRERGGKKVDGNWSEWGEWGGCAGNCGNTSTRYRSCTMPEPACGGKKCEGPHSDSVACPVDDCIIYVSSTISGTGVTIYSNGSIANTRMSSRRSLKIALGIGIFLGAVAVVAIVFVVIGIRRKRKKQKTSRYVGRSSPDIIRHERFYAETCFSDSQTNTDRKTAAKTTSVPLCDRDPMIDDVTYQNEETVNGSCQTDCTIPCTPDLYENVLATDQSEGREISAPSRHSSVTPSELERRESAYTYMTPDNTLTEEDAAEVPLATEAHYDYSRICATAGTVTEVPSPQNKISYYHDMSGSLKGDNSASLDRISEWHENDMYYSH